MTPYHIVIPYTYVKKMSFHMEAHVEVHCNVKQKKKFEKVPDVCHIWHFDFLCAHCKNRLLFFRVDSLLVQVVPGDYLYRYLRCTTACCQAGLFNSF